MVGRLQRIHHLTLSTHPHSQQSPPLDAPTLISRHTAFFPVVIDGDTLRTGFANSTVIL